MVQVSQQTEPDLYHKGAFNMNQNQAAESALQAMLADQERRAAERPAIEEAGAAALHRLFKVANGHSGQCKVVARFLLGCYNGQRFPFDLTDFRVIDAELFDDCMAVLKMDFRPKQEVHCYFPLGGRKFEKLAHGWRIDDASRIRLNLKKYREKYGPL
jgi:hypothetical protein